MKLTNPFTTGKKKQVSSTMMLDDTFQIAINHPDEAIQKQFAYLDKQFQENPDSMVSTGMECPFTSTNPYTTLFTFENIMILTNGSEKSTTLGDLPPEISIVEYDYPVADNKGNVPEAKEVVDEKRLNYRQPTGIKNFEHLPHLIAEAIMNFPDERADYEDRVEYISMILDFYDKKYGTLFSKIFGIRPTLKESVVLPSEANYAKAISNKEHVDVVGVVNDYEPEPKLVKPVDSESQVIANPEPEVTTNTEHAVQDNQESEGTTKLAPITPVEPKTKRTKKRPAKSTSLQPLDINYGLSDVVVPLNDVDNNIIIPDEDDRNFVNMAVQNDLKLMNDERLFLQETLNSNNQKQITSLLVKLQDELSKPLVTKESTTALLEAVTKKVDQELEDNFKESYELRLGTITNKKEVAINDENKRHDSAIADIEHQATIDTNNLTQTLHSENEAKRDQMIEDGLENAKQSRDEKTQAEVDALTNKMLASVKDLASELRANSQTTVQKLVEQQTARLEKNTQKYYAIHEKAVESHAKQLIAEREATIDNNIQKDLADLQSITEGYKNQVRIAENAKAELEAEIRGLRNNNMQNSQSVPPFAMSPSDLINQQVQLQSEQDKDSANAEAVAKNKRGKNLAAFTVGVVALASLGGLMYTQNASAEKRDDAQAKRVSQLESELSSNKLVLKSSNSSSISDNSNQTSATSSISLDTLDTDIAGGNLNVYDQYYKDSDLKTEARTLLVGRLLINSGRTADAQSLAKANVGHNSLLISELNN